MPNPDPEMKISHGVSSMAAEALLERSAPDEEVVQKPAEMAEIMAMLDRIDRALTVEEALTRQLMARHGL